MPWKKVYATDFVNGFAVTDSGFDVNGKPCWQSRFPYGRIMNNGEAGLYADSVVHPGTDPFPVGPDGKRRLRSERLTKPIQGENNKHEMQDYHYSASLMTSKNVVTINNGSRVDVKASFPHVMRKGYWPGIPWAIPVDDTWPPETDVMEWWLHNEWDRPDAFWSSQHEWVDNKLKSDSKFVRLSDLGIQGDLTQPLTFQLQLWSKEIVTFVNDKEVSRRPNTKPGLARYIILDLAVGGDPWPGAPDEKTVFPQEVILHDMKVYQQA